MRDYYSIIVSFEGIDGSGKSTQSKLFNDTLCETGYQSRLITPSDKKLTQFILEIFNKNCPLDPEVVFYLCAANESLVDLTREGIFVFDRYVDSIIAPAMLFGVSEGIISSVINGFMEPYIAFLLDISAESSYSRKEGDISPFETGSSDYFRGSEYSSFLGFQSDLRTQHLELASKSPERYHVVDADQSINTIHDDIMRVFYGKGGIMNERRG